MKEKRKGPISRAGGLVDSVAATVRRMQREREPRVLAYDPTGYARLIQPEAGGHAAILELAEEMVGFAATPEPDDGQAPAAEARRRRRRMTLVEPGLAGQVLRQALSAAATSPSSTRSRVTASGCRRTTAGWSVRRRARARHLRPGRAASPPTTGTWTEWPSRI